MIVILTMPNPFHSTLQMSIRRHRSTQMIVILNTTDQFHSTLGGNIQRSLNVLKYILNAFVVFFERLIWELEECDQNLNTIVQKYSAIIKRLEI